MSAARPWQASVVAPGHFRLRGTYQNKERILIKTVLLRMLGLFVMVPATLAAAYFSALAVAWLISASDQHFSSPDTTVKLLVFALVLGWVAIFTSWKLYYHFLVSSNPPSWWRTGIAGLGSGYIAIIAFFLAAPDVFLAEPSLLSMPTLAASTLLALLIRSKLSHR